MSADEEGVETGGAKLDEIVVRAQAGFADGDAMMRDAVDQFERSLDASCESLEVAIVHANDARASGQGPIEFSIRVHLDQRFHSKFSPERDEIAKKVILKHSDYEKKTVGVVGARFPDLPGVEDEVFAEHGELDRFASVAEIFQRAAEEFRFGEHRKRGSARGFKGLRQGNGIEGIANQTARRRGRLEFGKHIEAIAIEGSRKIANWRGGFHAIPQGRFWKDAFAMVHLGAARFENAVEHRSGVGLSRHFDNFVC